MLRHFKVSYLGLFGILLFLCHLNAQEFRSTLAGRVIDQTGAVVVGAKVQAVEMGTNSRYDTVANSDGLFSFPMLLPGQYELKVDAKGFKGYDQKGIQINSNARVSQDVTLTVGASSESITITADAAPMETIRASAGQSITAHELENLPLDGHTALDAEFLGFGVISQANRDANSPSGNAGFATITMGGAASGANAIFLDGVPDDGTAGVTGKRPAFLPPTDSVSEVKVEAFSMDASTGGAGGGTAEMITKSGTNQLHGALSEYSNNSALQATAFYVNSVGGTKPKSETNQWSAVVGGPVWIPKLFNGKNRVFFLFAYEGIHSGGPTAVFGSTPTAAERTGDFSALLALNNSTHNYTLYDPNTAVLSGGVITRQPFPNNVIPSNRLNPVATNFINTYMPLPNRTGVYDDTNNYGANEVAQNPYHFFSGRGDINISDKNKLTLVGRESMYEQVNGALFNNIAYLNNYLYRASWGGMADDVHTFSPTMVGDLRLGFNRYDPYYGQASSGYNPTQLGLPSYLGTTHPMMPSFSLTGYTGNTGGNYSNQPLNTYQLFNSYTKIKGAHIIKFGGEVRLIDDSSISWANADGIFTFDGGTWVKQTSNATAPTSGGSMAQFLLGLPTSGTQSLTTPWKMDSYYTALFAQDDWHVLSNLTFNLGLRWERSGPDVESHDRQIVGFNSTAVNQVTQAAQTAYAKSPISQLPVSSFSPTGGVSFASSSQRAAYTSPNTSFAPRIGVSWVPKFLHGKTVLRSGMGIFYYNYGIVGPNTPGFSASTTLVPTSNSYLTPATTLSNPFPSGITQPNGSSQGVNTYLGQSITFNNPNLANQYGLRWDFDVQQQLAKDLTLEVAYIGNHAVHLTTSYNYDSVPVQFLSTSPFRDTATINALGAIVSNPFSGLIPGQTLNGSTTAVSSLLGRYPEFSGVTESNMNNGDSYFNQLAIKLQKRFTNGLQFFVNFSHSRLMSNTTYLNSGSLALSKQVASDDRPNYLVIAGIYDLPFGKGLHYLANAPKPVMFLLGNWQIGVNYSYFPGAPLSFGNDIYLGAPLNYDASNPNGAAFNTAAFVTNSAAQLASNFRTFPSAFNNLRLDSANNIDLNLTKSFVLHERLKLEFRGESYNLCNRPLFESPNMTVTASTFGYITSTTNSPRAIQLALRLTF